MPADRDRAHLRRAGRRRRLRLADRHEPERRRRDRAARPQPARRSPRSGPGTAEALRAHGIEPAFVPRESSQDGLLREFPRPAGPGALRGGRGRAPAARSTSSAPTSCRSTARGCSEPEPPAGDVVVLASGSAARAYAGDRRRGAGGHDRARDVAGRARRSGSRSPPRRRRTISTASSPRCAM